MSKKTLVVEDSFDLRELLGAGLVALGWEPTLAANGQSSLTCLARDTPRVILMDMGLGDMKGFDLAAVLKRHPTYKRIPILGTTALPSLKVRQHCLSAGCDDFIANPFGFAALHKRLAQLLFGERPSVPTAA